MSVAFKALMMYRWCYRSWPRGARLLVGGWGYNIYNTVLYLSYERSMCRFCGNTGERCPTLSIRMWYGEGVWGRWHSNRMLRDQQEFSKYRTENRALWLLKTYYLKTRKWEAAWYNMGSTCIEARVVAKRMIRAQHNSTYKTFLRLKKTECGSINLEIHKVPEGK